MGMNNMAKTCFNSDCDNDPVSKHFESRCEWCQKMHEEEMDLPVIRKLKSTVRSVPGMGDSGRRFEIVERGCELCGYDRMLRETGVNPESPWTVEFGCMNPGCSGFSPSKIR